MHFVTEQFIQINKAGNFSYSLLNSSQLTNTAGNYIHKIITFVVLNFGCWVEC